MKRELRQVAKGVHATFRAMMQTDVADVIAFDMDGVLIDVHDSYPSVICEAVATYLQEEGFEGEGAVVPEETAWFKAAGGFNSDWTLAQGIALIYLVKAATFGTRVISALRQAPPELAAVAREAGQYGGGIEGLMRSLSQLISPGDFERVRAGWNTARITRLAQEYYAGDNAERVFGIPNQTVRGPGRMMRERPLVDRQTLEAAPFRYGLYTGRNRGEVDSAVQMAGLEGVFRETAIVTEDMGIRKPNPAGLVRIAQALGPRLMIYAGDNLDDWQVGARYEAERSLDAPPCLFCGILGGSPGPLAYSLFEDRGVDFMADSVADLLNWLKSRRTGS